MKDFTQYPEALELKQLGYPQNDYFAWYGHDGLHYDSEYIEEDFTYACCSAPTYSQAFRFFRENYDIHYSIDRERSQHDFEWGYNWSIYNYTGLCEEYVTSHPDAPAGEWVYETYEEAELACLKEMIKIVKEKQ